MTGTDIFVGVLFAIIFFGGIFLNFRSRKLVDLYNAEHRVQPVNVKGVNQKSVKSIKK